MKTMKKVALAGLMAFAATSFAQLQDEKNVTITMDLQPVLQLKMEGPDQLDFTFDEINEYYSGITKYGATILKVSASVSWDLWAAGLSQGSVCARCWDNPIEYATAAGAVDEIPITALELHQFPANPAIGGACATGSSSVEMDYSEAFAPRTAAATVAGNNACYAPLATAPYTAPTSAAVAANTEKYIAGATGTGANCQVAGGSYLLQSALGTSNFYYVMDYRILPDLPVVFPSHITANNDNSGAGYVTAADALTTLNVAGAYAQPGVYTMYVKYILAQDQ